MEAYGEQLFDEDTKKLNISKVDVNKEEFEGLVEEYLVGLQRKMLYGEVVKASEPTPKAVAMWIIEKEPAFKKRSLISIESAVEYSCAWINRDEILDVK